MRKFRHHRARRESRSLPAPEHLELPFDYWPLALSCRPRNPSRWIDRRQPPWPIRPATNRAKRAQTYTAPMSSFLDNIKEKVRQCHLFWLTSPMSPYTAEVNQKGCLTRGSTLPSFDSGKEPEPSSGRPHVERGSRRSLQTNPLEHHERQPFCPRCGCVGVYTFKTRALFKCKACDHQFSVTSGTIFASRKLPISNDPSRHRDLRKRRERP